MINCHSHYGNQNFDYKRIEGGKKSYIYDPAKNIIYLYLGANCALIKILLGANVHYHAMHLIKCVLVKG